MTLPESVVLGLLWGALTIALCKSPEGRAAYDHEAAILPTPTQREYFASLAE